MIAANSFGSASNGWMRGMSGSGLGRACQVSLIDRRTGRAHRVGGQPIVLFTRDPQAAVNEILAGRDARLWEARVEPLDPYEVAQ